MNIEMFTVGPFQENTYILWDEAGKEAYIVDPGGENERILAFIDKNELAVKAIINTHGHVDHIAGVNELKEKLGAPFNVHSGEIPVIEASERSANFFGIHFGPTPKVDGILEEGEILKLGATEIKVLHTPGHSPGGICFLADADVIVGDTLFALSIGRTDLPGGSYDQIMNSIKTKLLTLEDSVRVFPGHGPVTTIGHERRMNPFLA